MKYVAEPFIVEAIQWDGTEEGAEKIKKEFGFDYRMGHMDYDNKKLMLEIYAESGATLLNKGEYLIKDLIGEPFACKARIFKQRFKEIKD